MKAVLHFSILLSFIYTIPVWAGDGGELETCPPAVAQLEPVPQKKGFIRRNKRSLALVAVIGAALVLPVYPYANQGYVSPIALGYVKARDAWKASGPDNSQQMSELTVSRENRLKQQDRIQANQKSNPQGIRRK